MIATVLQPSRSTHLLTNYQRCGSDCPGCFPYLWNNRCYILQQMAWQASVHHSRIFPVSWSLKTRYKLVKKMYRFLKMLLLKRCHSTISSRAPTIRNHFLFCIFFVKVYVNYKVWCRPGYIYCCSSSSCLLFSRHLLSSSWPWEPHPWQLWTWLSRDLRSQASRSTVYQAVAEGCNNYPIPHLAEIFPCKK